MSANSTHRLPFILSHLKSSPRTDLSIPLIFLKRGLSYLTTIHMSYVSGACHRIISPALTGMIKQGGGDGSTYHAVRVPSMKRRVKPLKVTGIFKENQQSRQQDRGNTGLLAPSDNRLTIPWIQSMYLSHILDTGKTTLPELCLTTGGHLMHESQYMPSLSRFSLLWLIPEKIK